MLGAFLLSVLLFADDLVLAAHKCHMAQRLLDLLHTWCEDNGLRVNTGKTKWMRIRGRKRAIRDGDRGGDTGEGEGL